MKDRQLLLAILAQLEREKTVSIPQLAQLLGVDEEHVFKALEVLVFAYDAASVRLDLHDSYATLETFGTDRLLRLTPQEADTLVDALYRAGFSPSDELVQALLQTKSIVTTASTNAEPRVRVIAEPNAPLVTQSLAEACEDPDHHLLEIGYWGVNDDRAELRQVEPLMLFSEEGRQYLLAFCLNAQDWRSFRVDRISSASPLPETFIPRKDAPVPKLLLEKDAIESTVWFAPGSFPSQWRNIKLVTRNEDGSCVASIPWTGSLWLPKRIVALMGRAKPLSPDSLVNACQNYAESLLQAASMQGDSNVSLDGNASSE